MTRTDQPPTEEEIRALINDHLGPFDVGEAISEVIALVSYHDEDSAQEGPLWTNLDPSEQTRLEELIDGVYDMADEFEAQVVDATVHAALTFAAEYPNAWRASLPGRLQG